MFQKIVDKPCVIFDPSESNSFNESSSSTTIWNVDYSEFAARSQTSGRIKQDKLQNHKFNNTNIQFICNYNYGKNKNNGLHKMIFRQYQSLFVNPFIL